MFSVRPYRTHHAAQVARLFASVANPYRQEDADNVLAMQRRALRAQEAGDRWSPLRTDEPDLGEHAHLAFWVAVATNGVDEEVIGTLGLRRVGDEETARSDTAERSGLPSTGDWVSRGDVGESDVSVWRSNGAVAASLPPSRDN